MKLGIQDFYPEELSHCFGCGRNNPNGHQLKSYWEGEFTKAKYTPKEFQTAIAGFVYGGLIASLIDCHGTGSAALASYKNEHREPGSEPALRFVTASLNVDYVKPTPIGVELILVGKILEITNKKVITQIEVFANDVITAVGKVVAVKMPDSFIAK
ncbi:MAG TPA: PaaI family thioesterase [Ignavibacteriaceae bacterium]|nr:PaaI family thioesterase [Ignavibacteriaceae bacterium]